jgi:hypothetical protein
MATRAVFLPTGAEFPTSAFPQATVLSGGATPRPALAYDATTDENAYWTDVAAQGFTGAVTVVISYAIAATTGAVRWQCALEAVTAGDALNLNTTDSFDTDNSGGATVPGTTYNLAQQSITMTNADSIAAGDMYRLRVRRDADGTSGTDDAAGDCYVLAVELRDAA